MPKQEEEPIRQINVRLFEADIAEIRAEAKSRGVSAHELIRHAVREGWRRMKIDRDISGVG